MLKSFIEYLNNNKIDYLFLTNNSTKEPKDVAEHLKKFAIYTSEEHVLLQVMLLKFILNLKDIKTYM